MKMKILSIIALLALPALAQSREVSNSDLDVTIVLPDSAQSGEWSLGGCYDPTISNLICHFFTWGESNKCDDRATRLKVCKTVELNFNIQYVRSIAILEGHEIDHDSAPYIRDILMRIRPRVERVDQSKWDDDISHIIDCVAEDRLREQNVSLYQLKDPEMMPTVLDIIEGVLERQRILSREELNDTLHERLNVSSCVL